MGWEQLISIQREATEEASKERTQAPSACPNDGEPLKVGPDGVPYCPFDGWRDPFGARAQP